MKRQGALVVSLLAAGCGNVIVDENLGDSALPLTSVTTTVEFPLGTIGRSVNSSGAAVGRVLDNAFVWENDVLTYIMPPNTFNAEPFIITESGRIAGWTGYMRRAAIWLEDRSDVIVLDPQSSDESFVRYMNTSLEALGRRCTSGSAPCIDGAGRAFFWSPSQGLIELGDPNDPHSEGRGINESGTVVGWTGNAQSPITRAFAWSVDSGMTILPGLGENPTIAVGINDNGEIAGYSSVTGGARHAVKWDNGVIHDLHPAGADASAANDINNNGDVVGWYRIGETSHAALWRQGTLIDLGVVDGVAMRISELDIVGGRRDDGHGFVWTNPAEGPVDLPATNPNLGTLMDLSGAWALGLGALWQIEVTPVGTDEAIADIQADVVTLPTLTPGEKTSLDAKLQAALHQCEQGRENAARSQLTAFIHHVEAFINSGKLTPEEGAALIEKVETILANLDCS